MKNHTPQFFELVRVVFVSGHLQDEFDFFGESESLAELFSVSIDRAREHVVLAPPQRCFTIVFLPSLEMDGIVMDL